MRKDARAAQGPRQGARPSKRQLQLGAWFIAAMHILPMGLVQFADYASDLFVVFGFKQQGAHVEYSIGGACILASIGFVWLYALGIFVLWMLVEQSWKVRLQCSLAWRCVLLAPFNLHTLYLGVRVAGLKSQRAVAKTALAGNPELWQQSDALDEQLSALYRRPPAGLRGDELKREIEACKSRIETVRSNIMRADPKAKAYFDTEKELVSTYTLFVVSKVVETAVESVPLSILTASALFDSSDPTGPALNQGLLMSSLALSWLSMSYGFFSAVLEDHAFFDRKSWTHTSASCAQFCRSKRRTGKSSR